MKLASAAVLAVLAGAAGMAQAQSTIVTKTAPPPISYTPSSAPNVTIAPQTTTVYTQPGQGPAGNPIPGSQAGSSATTSYGAAVTISTDILGGGKK